MSLPERGDQPSPTHCRASPRTHHILAAVPGVPCFQAAACSPQGPGTQPIGSPGEQGQAGRGEWGSGRRGGMMPGSWRCAWAPRMVLGWVQRRRGPVPGLARGWHGWPGEGSLPGHGWGRPDQPRPRGAPRQRGEAGVWGGYWA